MVDTLGKIAIIILCVCHTRIKVFRPHCNLVHDLGIFSEHNTVSTESKGCTFSVPVNYLKKLPCKK